MDIREGLRYSVDHEWVEVVEGRVRVGITDYAQDALGDVVFVDLPSVEQRVAAGESFGEVESTKSVSDLFAPVSGTVSAVNADLADSPELINADPYGEGWICTIEPDDLADLESLLDADGYRDLIAG